jgi:S-formylglutathione hydrolase FrmB
MKKIRFLILALFLIQHVYTTAATVDTLDVPSAVMNKTYKAAVVLPMGYAKSKAEYPVVYLLHGGYGHFNDWLLKTPDKMLVQNLADQYHVIVVLPEGEVFSYYLDSPVDKGSQFETYVTKEVIEKIDNTYRTIHDRKGRVITGLSMGGYGALYLATLHPNLYVAAGSMSGALNPDMMKWKVDSTREKGIRSQFEKILGSNVTNPGSYVPYSVIGMADRMKTNGVELIFDCGVDDFLIEPNRELHRRLVFNNTPHDYSERPGTHAWPYWQNSLTYHFLFFSKVFKANGVAIP